MVFDELMGNFIFYPGFPDFKGFVDFVERDGDPCFCVRMHYVMASCREMEGVPGMRRFRTKIEQGLLEKSIQTSIGIAVYAGTEDECNENITLEELVKMADANMYRIKEDHHSQK